MSSVLDVEADRNRAVARAVETVSILGYGVVVVPRNATVTVTGLDGPALQAPA